MRCMLEITKLKGVKEPKAGILIYEFGLQKKKKIWECGAQGLFRWGSQTAFGLRVNYIASVFGHEYFAREFIYA